MEEPTWEPPPETPVRQGPGLGMIGGSALAAALQKRKQKVGDTDEGVSGAVPVAVVEEEVVEEVVVLPPRMKEIKQNDEAPQASAAEETAPSQPTTEPVQAQPQESTTDQTNDDEWS